MTTVSAVVPAEEALLSEALNQTVLNALSIGIVILDQDLRIVCWNDWLAQRSGKLFSATRSLRLDELFPELAGSHLLRACQQALLAQLSSLLSSSLHRSPLPLFAPGKASSKQRLDQAITVRPLRVSGTSRCALIEVHDVTASNQKEQLLRRQALTLSWQATHDALTGVGNRTLLLQALEDHLLQTKNSAYQHCLLLFDLDKFKPVNDTFGHQAGDELIKQIAELLRANSRGGDIVTRLGGDEFALLLPYCPLEEAKQIGQHICQSIDAYQFHWQGQTARIGASAGLCQLSSRVNTASDALRIVDEALYAAKHAGGGQVAVANQSNERSI